MLLIIQICQQSGKLVAACTVVELGRVAYIRSTKTLVSLASPRANARSWADLGPRLLCESSYESSYESGYEPSYEPSYESSLGHVNRAMNRASCLRIEL